MLPPRPRALILEPRDHGLLLEADVASETKMRDSVLAGSSTNPRFRNVEELRDLTRVEETVAHRRHHAPQTL
jgi:hypothetical protein